MPHFDLEKAVAAWRNQFRYRPRVLDVDVDELDRHLRDQVQHLVDEGGLTPEAAFRQAVAEMGSFGEAEEEYGKVYWSKLKHHRLRRRELAWRITMLLNYLKNAFRNLRKHRGYASINIAGLGIGLACCFLILLYVRDERSYERHHSKADRIFRVLDFRMLDGIGERSSSAPFPLAPALKNEYPDDIEAAVRFFNFQSPSLSLAYESPGGEARQFNEQRLFFVDAGVFRVFDFQFLLGDPASALQEPNAIVLTAGMAEKYFGGADPMGKTLRFEGEHDFVVTGLLGDLPSNSHLQFDFLVSFSTLDNPAVLAEGLIDRWIWNPCWTYVLLNESTRPPTLEAEFPAFVQRHFPESRRDRVTLHLQPLPDIHLYSDLDYEMGTNSDVAYVYIFSVVALFILLIACINFVNLSTARSVGRAREVGLRKVLGAYRLQLIRQFLTESTLTALCALFLALPLIWLLLPVLNAISGKALAFSPVHDAGLLLGLVGLAVGVGVVAGLYPAFFLSSHRPIQALKGGLQARSLRAATLFRKALVVGQFSLSVMLIVGTLVAMKQLDYLQTQNLGIDGEQVLLLPTLRSPVFEKFDAFKEALLQHPGVLALTTAEDIPGMKHQTGGYHPAGFSEEQQFARLIVHDDFATTLGVEMVAGREFQRAFPSDAEDAVIINEAMVRLLGWPSNADAIGKDFDGDTVVGVTEDFHFTSLHRPVGPFVLQRVSNDLGALFFSGRYIAIRIEASGLTETLDFIERQWTEFVPERPYESFFLDEALRGQYRAEATLSRVAGVFALLSVLVACLGLFGLSSFMAERRTKEIGIRKALGASTADVVVLFSTSFVGLVVLSMLVAWPVAYILMHGWLGQFAYRTPIGWAPFAVAGGATLLIACVTISYHAMRASRAAPTESLRYE